MSSPSYRRKRKLVSKAHSLFDPIWQGGEKSRSKAYRWLSFKMSLPMQAAHFSRMTESQLREAIVMLEERAA